MTINVAQEYTASSPVPVEYIGVWQRDLLETATMKDDTTLVLWMQTNQYHIDIRIPASLAAISTVHTLEDYNNKELLILAGQQGFAGITQVTPGTAKSSDLCQWHREIDFQPQTDARDIGKMVFTDANTIIETGIDDVYLEVWRRLEDSQKPCLFKFTTGRNRKGLATPAYCMRAGNFIAYARPRQISLPKIDSLINAIVTIKPARDKLLDWLDTEISFGDLIDEQHWKIKHSTLPFKQGLIVGL